MADLPANETPNYFSPTNLLALPPDKEEELRRKLLSRMVYFLCHEPGSFYSTEEYYGLTSEYAAFSTLPVPKFPYKFKQEQLMSSLVIAFLHQAETKSPLKFAHYEVNCYLPNKTTIEKAALNYMESEEFVTVSKQLALERLDGIDSKVQRMQHNLRTYLNNPFGSKNLEQLTSSRLDS